MPPTASGLSRTVEAAVRFDIASAVDPLDAETARRDDYRETEARVANASGAARVVAFDPNARSGPRAKADEPGIRHLVESTHNDHSDRSGPGAGP